MASNQNIQGERWHKLTAVSFVSTNKNGHKIWLFQCDCGNETEAFVTNVRSGKTQSCGCHRIHNKLTHGGSYDQTYAVWVQMKGRCNYPDHQGYSNYGALGISVCDAWNESYAAFMSDMGPRPEGMTIDRINPFGNYEPSNCRWATPQEQAWNKKVHWDGTSPVGITGVYFLRSRSRWIAAVKRDGKWKTVGSYKTFDDAVNAQKSALALDSD